MEGKGLHLHGSGELSWPVRGFASNHVGWDHMALDILEEVSFKALPHSEFEASLEGLLGFVAPNSINCRSPPATLAGRDQAVLAQAWCFP
ncbi:uncharacterized protein [Lolium perenne]|uniref:uncharacterized protein n=1 Tax=Lolium perenne TaxID=4522 RepID=UPI003A997C9B